MNRNIKNEIKQVLTELNKDDNQLIESLYKCYLICCDSNIPSSEYKKELEKILGRNVALEDVSVNKRVIEKLIKLVKID